MFCPKCGTQIPDGGKFCPSCGAAIQQQTNANAVKQAPAPQQPAKPPAPTNTVDVKNIIKSPPKVATLDNIMDFKAAEKALEDGLKTQAFSGLFSSVQPSEVRVDSLTMIYEPVHRVRAVYEGSFEVVKDFNLALDPDTVKVTIAGKSYDIKPTGSGGLFGGSSSSLKLTGTELVKKRREKAIYYDMNGVQKSNIDNYVRGKKTKTFDPSKKIPRAQILGTQFDASGLTDQVITPEIVQRQQNAKKTIGEKITVDVDTIYFPKYKALVTNLKNSQQKYVIFSAADKQTFQTETF
jgi:hypothetical protein